VALNVDQLAVMQGRLSLDVCLRLLECPLKEVETNGKLDIRERTPKYHFVALSMDQLMDVGKRGDAC
jgi:hypothetical protein